MLEMTEGQIITLCIMTIAVLVALLAIECCAYIRLHRRHRECRHALSKQIKINQELRDDRKFMLQRMK